MCIVSSMFRISNESPPDQETRPLPNGTGQRHSIFLRGVSCEISSCSSEGVALSGDLGWKLDERGRADERAAGSFGRAEDGRIASMVERLRLCVVYLLYWESVDGLDPKIHQ